MGKTIKIIFLNSVIIGLFGGIGGFINMSLSYFKFTPTSLLGIYPSEEYDLWLLLGGFIHGFTLAFVAIFFSALFFNKSSWARIFVWPFVGWFSGWVSMIPVFMDHIDGSFSQKLLVAAQFPWGLSKTPWDFILGPFWTFGGVAFLLFGGLSFFWAFRSEKIFPLLLTTALSGILGSIFIFSWQLDWYISLIHGTIWGLLVGFGLLKFNPIEN